DNRFYVEVQGLYKQVTHQLYEWLGKETVNGVANYQELEHFRYRRTIWGAQMIAGSLVPIKDGLCYFDFYFGLGFKHKDAWIVGEPRSHYEGFTNFGATATTDHITV